MKKFQLYTLFLMLFLVTGCEQDSLDTTIDPGSESFLKQDDQSFLELKKVLPGMERFESQPEFDKYLNSLSKLENVTAGSRSVTSGDSEIFSSSDEFAAFCGELQTEDFSDQANLDPNFELSSESGFTFFFPLFLFNSQAGTGILPQSGLDKLYLDITSDNINMVGLDLYDFDFFTGGTLQIDIYGENGLIQSESQSTPVPFQRNFWAISTKEPITRIEMYSTDNSVHVALDKITYGTCSVDADGDGCLDEDDPFVNSNMDEFINIDGCDTGIENKLTENCGVMMADLIGEAMATSKNHGEFVSEITHYANKWVEEGLIDTNEKSAIISCASKADKP